DLELIPALHLGSIGDCERCRCAGRLLQRDRVTEYARDLVLFLHELLANKDEVARLECRRILDPDRGGAGLNRLDHGLNRRSVVLRPADRRGANLARGIDLHEIQPVRASGIAALGGEGSIADAISNGKSAVLGHPDSMAYAHARRCVWTTQ